VTATCCRCGFGFDHEGSRALLCPDCRTVPDGGPGRPTSVLVQQLAGEVTTLRLAVEAARRRIGMAVIGHGIGRDNLATALAEADDLMLVACQVYTRLSVTRPYDEGPAIPHQRHAA
jgi:hypothetical protein